MNLFRSPFEKLSADNLGQISAATSVTAATLTPGGALFMKVEEMISFLKKIEENTRKGIEISRVDPKTLKLIGPAAQGIATAFKIIVEALNAAPDSTEMQAKVDAIIGGMSAVVGLGKAIFTFAGLLALSLPLLIIGMIALPVAMVMIGLVAATFFMIDKLGIADTIEKTSRGLAIAGLAVIALAGSFALSYLILDATFSGVGGGAIAGTGIFLATLVLGTAAVFSIAGLLSSFIQKGAIAIGISGLSILLLAASFAIFRQAVPPTAEGWTTLGQIGAAVTGLGVVMALAGAAAMFIFPGAAAMIVAGLALILVSAGFAAISDVIKPGKFDFLLADSGHVTEGFLGFGAGRPMSNMEWSLLSLARSFTLPPKSIVAMFAAAPALIMSGMALVMISKGIERFQSMSIDYETLPGQINKVTTVLADAFGKIGQKYPGGGAGLIGAIFGSGSGTSDVAQGISAVSGMGKALTGIATGVQQMALLRFPTKFDKDGNPIAFRTLKDEDFDAVTRNTQKIVAALSTTFGKIGASPEAKDSWGWFGNSKVEEGIEIVKKMSNPLANLAKFIQTFASQKIDVKGTVDKTRQMIGAMTAIFVNGGQNMTSEQLVKSADAYEDMADAMEDMADAMGDWVESVNDLDLKKVTEVRKLYEGLAFLTKNGGETAVEKMGQSLVEALNNLSDLLEKAGSGRGRGGGILEGLLGGSPAAAPAAAPVAATSTAAAAATKSMPQSPEVAKAIERLNSLLDEGIRVNVSQI